MRTVPVSDAASSRCTAGTSTRVKRPPALSAIPYPDDLIRAEEENVRSFGSALLDRFGKPALEKSVKAALVANVKQEMVRLRGIRELERELSGGDE